VVEGERDRGIARVDPAGQRVGCLRARRDEREVGDRGDPAARVAAGIGERPELLDVWLAEPGLLVQLSQRRVLRALGRPDEAARQRARTVVAPGRQGAQAPVARGQDDDVGGERRGRRIALAVRGRPVDGRELSRT
jgi:hypothetical protein